ncbi:MAG: hypothetical protein NTZ39_03460 [Methanoregula sp.]|nr:hypothetical protein [Methanoregula sp.]
MVQEQLGRCCGIVRTDHELQIGNLFRQWLGKQVNTDNCDTDDNERDKKDRPHNL